MGRHKRILASTKLKTLPKYWEKTRIEAGEEELMHFHWRDLRILFLPTTQFRIFYKTVKNGFKNWDGKFIKDKDIYVSRKNIPGEIILGNEIKIEESTSGIIHCHYRDIRLELTPEDFLAMADTFMAAAETYKVRWEEMILIDRINPYDRSHQETEKQWRRGKADWDYHRDGIEILKTGIKKGGQILPVLVMKSKIGLYEYQRLDGYKRLMAYKELGMKEIPCFVNKEKEIEPLRQHRTSFWRISPDV